MISYHDSVVSANIPAKERQNLINKLPDDVWLNTLTTEWKEQIVQVLFGFCLMILELVRQHERNTECYTTQASIENGHLYLIYNEHL